MAATYIFASNVDTSGVSALGDTQTNRVRSRYSDPFQEEEISVSILKIRGSFDFTSYYKFSLIIQK